MTSEDRTERSLPEQIAEKAAQIYASLDDSIKTAHAGHFMVVDIKGGGHYTAEFSEEAFKKARECAPYGVLHLIRIGAPSAFKFSFSASHDSNWSWPLRRAR